MADTKIGDLPRATKVDDSSLLVAEQMDKAVAVTGAQFKAYAKEAVADDVQRAVNAAGTAESAADIATTAKNTATQSATAASASATNAARSEGNAKASETAAITAANRAAAEAERVTVPAAVGVYNVVLTDRVTNERYALIVENGRLAILGVSETLEATDMNFIDTATGTAYELTVESGRLNLKEV